MNNENYKNTAYLDILRWIAIGAIVMLHVSSGIVDTIPEQMTAEQQNIYKIIKNMMTIGVPYSYILDTCIGAFSYNIGDYAENSGT